MFTEIDEGTGVVRTTWEKISDRVRVVDSELADLIDELSPGNNFPLYLIYLPYGMLKGDTNSSYLPKSDGGFCKLSDETLPKEMQKELGYGKWTSPLGMILQNKIEYFIELDGEIIPYDIAGPGHIFNKSIILNKNSLRNYSPNKLLLAAAGSRSNFLLPSINNHNSLLKLGRVIKSKLAVPKKISDHWHIFKKITSQNYKYSAWRVCLLYFSEKWINALTNDNSWNKLKSYISEKDRIKNQYKSNSTFYEIFFSYIQRKYNLKISNPYVTNTAIHLIKISLGEMPGFIPADDETLLPLSEIQTTFIHYYGLDNYPTVMTPHVFDFENEESPIYYSLQHPTMPSFSIKKNDRISASSEISALNYILPSFMQAMNLEGGMLSGTVFEKLSNAIQFSYFHNIKGLGENVVNSVELPFYDSRFTKDLGYSNKRFCHEGKFLRGCIGIMSYPV